MATIVETLAGLPTFENASTNLDDQSRAALRLLFLAAQRAKPQSSLPYDPILCPNCGGRTGSSRTPYCSDRCRSTAALVRQARAGLADGTILREDRQVAFGENLWRLLGGGYPRRQGLVLDRVLKRVAKRTGGHCESCGAPAVTVDHIGSG